MPHFSLPSCSELIYPDFIHQRNTILATHHAQAGEVVDLASWADDLPSQQSKAIAKGKGLELARLVIKASVDMHKHDYCHVDGPIVVHCIDGVINLKKPDSQIRLSAGLLTWLEGRTAHALTGVQDSIVLLTIVLV